MTKNIRLVNLTSTFRYSCSLHCNKYYNERLIKKHNMVFCVVVIESIGIDNYIIILLYNICIDDLLARSFYVGLYACIEILMIILCLII